MNECIFCKIIKGEIPAHIVYQDDRFLAFLDINPRAPGHVQIVPKEHFRWVWDLPKNEIGKYFEVTQKIALALKKVFSHEMIRSQIFGDEVPHAHIWLWPNIDKDGSENNFEEIKEKIKTAL
jgi:histidine triad (HIT) family protein